MPKLEGDPGSSRGNIIIGVAEVFMDLEEGQEVARTAMEEDREFQRAWLDENFSFTFGSRRNEPNFVLYETKDSSILGCALANPGPLVETYQRETLGRVLTILNHDFSTQIEIPPYEGHNHEPFGISGTGALKVNETAGYDWLDPEDYGYKASVFIQDLPPMINAPEIQGLVRQQTAFKDLGIEGRPIQQFTGTIVRVPGYVCQFIRAFETHAVPPDLDQEFPNMVAVRAWRTESNS